MLRWKAPTREQQSRAPDPSTSARNFPSPREQRRAALATSASGSRWCGAWRLRSGCGAGEGRGERGAAGRAGCGGGALPSQVTARRPAPGREGGPGRLPFGSPGVGSATEPAGWGLPAVRVRPGGSCGPDSDTDSGGAGGPPGSHAHLPAPKTPRRALPAAASERERALVRLRNCTPSLGVAPPGSGFRLHTPGLEFRISQSSLFASWGKLGSSHFHLPSLPRATLSPLPVHRGSRPLPPDTLLWVHAHTFLYLALLWPHI